MDIKLSIGNEMDAIHVSREDVARNPVQLLAPIGTVVTHLSIFLEALFQGSL